MPYLCSVLFNYYTMICIENVTFGYNKYHNVLKDFSMEFKQSGVYGLLGKNGTGKSTLQYLIAGLLRPFSGEVRVDGVLVAKRLPDTMQNIFFVPEEYKLPEVELLRYVKALKPFYPRFSDEILNGSLDKFDLTTDLCLGGLSMGQKKKVYMCIALAANTRYLLLDEPTNGMDILSKSQFRKAVISSMADDKTVIVSTHQVHDVERMLDFVNIIGRNKVLLSMPLAGRDEALDLEKLFIDTLTNHTRQ